MKTLVAGIGNIFKGDDGFGVEVIKQLAPRVDRSRADVVDFGIRGLDLAYALLDGGYDRVIFVDVACRGEAPGTLYLIEPEIDAPKEIPDTHGMHPAKVLGWVKTMGGRIAKVRLVACEPGALASDEDLSVGLTKPVSEAVPLAVRAVEELLCTN